ncbi:MAG: glycosyltransferase family 4 protein [Planctomycetota bacterium]
MRILYITPGTGDNFYCENCLRDNIVVKGLNAIGHQASIVPLYLPVHHDTGLAAGDAPIFFGGVNVYLQQKLGVFRHSPRWLDRLLDHPRLLEAAGRMSGMTNNRDLGALTHSMLLGEHGHQAKEVARLLGFLIVGPRPDVVVLASSLLIGLAEPLSRGLGVPVVCQLQGESGFLDAMPAPWRSRCWRAMAAGCRHVAAFITVSTYYRGLMIRRLALDPQRVHVVHIGLEVDDFAPRAQEPRTAAVGFLSRLCPMKGLDLLVDAWLELRRQPRFARLQLHLAGGWLSSDLPYIRTQLRRIKRAGGLHDLRLRDARRREEKRRFLAGCTVLSTPARDAEGYGLFMLEAAATGVPVVQPDTPPFPEILDRAGHGVIYAASDPAGLRDALGGLLSDPAARELLAAQGRAGVAAHFDLVAYARRTVGVLSEAVALNAARCDR